MSDTNLDKMKAMQLRLAMRGKGRYTPPANVKRAPERGAGEGASPPAPEVQAATADAQESGERKE